MFCAEELDFEKAAKYPHNRTYQISEIEMMTMGKKGILRESLMKECDGRIDQLALDVKARIVLASDLRAVESKYHRQCYQNFKTNKSNNASLPSTRNLDSTKEEAFSQLCHSLEENISLDKQYTLENLRQMMITDVPPYS